MKKLNYLNISHILLRSYKSSYFSSLPYSAFKTNLFLDINPKHTKLKLNKFR
jgi:hypothetical protein